MIFWYDFFCAELTTGPRRGELLAPQWDDLGFSTVQRYYDEIRTEFTGEDVRAS